MELLNAEIYGASKSLEKIFDMELPVQTSMAIAKLSVKLSDAFQAVDKVRNGLITRYGSPDIKTNVVGLKPEDENWPKFIEELNELMAQKTEVVFKKVKLPEEVDGKPLMLKPSLLVLMEKFVEIESVQPEPLKSVR